MCIAIYKPAFKVISKEILKECFDSNKDGCGLAYINTDHLGVKRIKVYKSMFFNKFYEKYERAIRLNPDSPFIIHFRIATHGTVDTFNCHPFWINNNTVFIHNGIISGVSKDDKKSDTQMFNEEFLQHIDATLLLKDGPVKKLIEKFVIGSKLVVLNVEGDVSIYNESSGNWNDGVWYSNLSWKPINRGSVTYYKGGTTKTTFYRKHLSDVSYAPCEECGTYHQVTNMTPYRNSIELEVYCKNCSRKIQDKFKMNAVTTEQYIDWNNELALYN